jgi:hypothetical protein
MKKIGCIAGPLVAVAVLIFILLPAFITPKTSSIVKSDMNRLKQIGMACLMYAMDHRGEYPTDWTALTNNYANTPNLFVTHYHQKKEGSMSNVMEWTSFVYVPGLTTASPPRSVVAYLPLGHYKKREGGIILFADCSVEWQPPEQFRETLERTPTTPPSLPSGPRGRVPEGSSR